MAIASPRASTQAFRVPPATPYGDIQGAIADGDYQLVFDVLFEWIREIAEAEIGIMTGKINAVTSLTLDANQATTTVADPRVGANTALILVPATASASAEIGAGTIYQTYPNATLEQAVLNHANNARTDRTFACIFVG